MHYEVICITDLPIPFVLYFFFFFIYFILFCKLPDWSNNVNARPNYALQMHYEIIFITYLSIRFYYFILFLFYFLLLQVTRLGEIKIMAWSTTYLALYDRLCLIVIDNVSCTSVRSAETNNLVLIVKLLIRTCSLS